MTRVSAPCTHTRIIVNYTLVAHRVCMCACVYVCMCACVYVCLCVCVHHARLAGTRDICISDGADSGEVYSKRTHSIVREHILYRYERYTHF